MKNTDVNALLDRAKEVAWPEEWEEVNRALRDKSWEEAIRHPKAPAWACWGAINVLEGRWPEAEKVIMKSPEFIFWYSYYVLKDRWKEAEKTIRKSPEWACMYAIDIIKDRWKEAEKTIRKSPEWWSQYNYYV